MSDVRQIEKFTHKLEKAVVYVLLQVVDVRDLGANEEKTLGS